MVNNVAVKRNRVYKLTDAVQAAKNGRSVFFMTFLYSFRVEEFIASATD